MRTALLSARLQSESGDPCHALRIGGRTVLQWQADMALKLGCERIVCLCEGLSDPIIQVQQEVEAREGEFHAIQGPLQLVSLVAAGSDLLMIGDSLIIERAYAQDVLAQGRGIAAISSSSQIAQANPTVFERIDKDRAAAGLALLPSALVAKLADYPAESDPFSMLTRLGLQSGVPVRPIDEERLTDGDWTLVRSTDVVSDAQKRLFERANEGLSWVTPGEVLANAVARPVVASGARQAELYANGAGMVLLAASCAASYFSAPIAASVAVILGCFGLGISGRIAALKSIFQGLKPSRNITSKFNLLRDVLIAVSMAISSTSISEIALPVLALGVLAIASAMKLDGLRRFWADRTVHMALLLIALLFNQLDAATFGLGGAAMLSILLQLHRK